MLPPDKLKHIRLSVAKKRNYWLDSNFNSSSNSNINTVRFARYNFPDLAPAQALNFSFSYDKHPNPFFKIQALHVASPIFKYSKGPLYVLGRNNATSILQQAPFGAGFTENLIYEYGNNGYPSIFYSSFIQHYPGELQAVVITKLFLFMAGKRKYYALNSDIKHDNKRSFIVIFMEIF